MARKVKCQICKKELTNDKAFKVSNGKKNLYYCSEEEYMEYKKDSDARKNLMKLIASEVLNYEQAQLLPKVLIKKISELHKHYSYEIILETFNQQEENLKYWMGLENKFNNEYQKVNYMMAIISNNINDVFNLHKTKEKIVEKEYKIENEIVDTNLMNNISKRKRKVTDISEFLN